MAAPRISMRKIHDILRLFHEAGLSRRRIALRLSLSRDTVAKTFARAKAAGLTWPLPDELDEAALERLLYPPVESVPSHKRSVPDWAEVHRELKGKGVTLQLLWQEYKATHPEGYQYSWFCDLYRRWRRRLDLVMRQDHRAGEKLFVDYAGQTIPVIDPETGEERPAQLFVAVLGCSNYTYAEATFTQRLPDWIGSHERAFHFFGGVPEIVVPDNLKSGVHRAHRYEPDLNPTYQDLAQHYGVAILPARAGKPATKPRLRPACCWLSGGSWPACAAGASSRLRSSTRPSPNSWAASTTGPSRRWRVPGARCSRRSSGPRYARCRVHPTSTPSGRRCACTSTTTSRSRGTTTACRTSMPVSRSTHA